MSINEIKYQVNAFVDFLKALSPTEKIIAKTALVSALAGGGFVGVITSSERYPIEKEYALMNSCLKGSNYYFSLPSYQRYASCCAEYIAELEDEFSISDLEDGDFDRDDLPEIDCRD